jgi:hypothetical protein
MKALCWHGKGDIRCEAFQIPRSKMGVMSSSR